MARERGPCLRERLPGHCRKTGSLRGDIASSSPFLCRLAPRPPGKAGKEREREMNRWNDDGGKEEEGTGRGTGVVGNESLDVDVDKDDK